MSEAGRHSDADIPTSCLQVKEKISNAKHNTIPRNHTVMGWQFIQRRSEGAHSKDTEILLVRMMLQAHALL